MNQEQTILLGPQPAGANDANPDGAVGVALILLALGASMAVAGVYILFGTGWALIAGAVPVIALAATILRGLKRGA